MSISRSTAGWPSPAPDNERSIAFHLLGQIDHGQFLALQRRLVYELGAETRPRIVLLVCQHAPLITVGRRGSWAHIRLSGQQLRLRGLDVRWVSRGGGCVLHGPGQLAIYPLVPLEPLGWTVGEYLQRLQEALRATLAALGIAARPGEQDAGLWGRSGQLAALGVAVRNQVTQHGCFLNVNPPMAHYHYVATATSFSGFGSRRATMGCLAAERSQGVKITEVRAALVEHLAAGFDASQYHIFSGHPLLPGLTGSRKADVRAS